MMVRRNNGMLHTALAQKMNEPRMAFQGRHQQRVPLTQIQDNLTSEVRGRKQILLGSMGAAMTITQHSSRHRSS